MSEASEWVTNWYWQNQQLVYLDKWERRGLVNLCDVRKILKIKPLHLECTEEKDFSNSRVVFSIEANMEDYLMERETGKIIEGKKGYKNGTTVWTMVLENGKWKVENIEEDTMAIAYAKMKNSIPELFSKKNKSSGPIST